MCHPVGRAAKLAAVTFAFSTPPTIVAGTLAAGPQPLLAAPGDLLLRP